MQHLPSGFLNRPIAHRALHDIALGRPENSRAAIQAAIDSNYGIEIDLQLSADGQAMVFHDYDLDRLTYETGPVMQRTAQELAEISLKHGNECIPSLSQVLDLVDGRVPVLIEIKDQSRAMEPTDGALEKAVADALTKYRGDIAVMSFNPHSVVEMQKLCPDIPRGLTSCGYTGGLWDTLSQIERTKLQDFAYLEKGKVCFISHRHQDLDNKKIMDIWRKGYAILCWTIKSKDEESRARKIAQNVTFEGYHA